MEAQVYSTILIATDGSELANNALDQGCELAKRFGAAVTIVTVTEPATVVGAGYSAAAGVGYSPIPELMEAQQAQAQTTLNESKARAEAAGVSANTRLVEGVYPAEGIVQVADEIGADLIVMASHGRRGLGRLLLGSQTSNVLAQTRIPVLVTR
jgi:nucleotide-binding universal stress UspA family protein